MTTPQPSLRTARGRFAPGCSGNPKGRPKGARNKATLLAERLASLEGEEAKAFVRTLADDARGGDTAALRFLARHLAPPPAPKTPRLPPGAERDPRRFYAATKVATGP